MFSKFCWLRSAATCNVDNKCPGPQGHLLPGIYRPFHGPRTWTLIWNPYIPAVVQTPPESSRGPKNLRIRCLPGGPGLVINTTVRTVHSKKLEYDCPPTPRSGEEGKPADRPEPIYQTFGVYPNYYDKCTYPTYKSMYNDPWTSKQGHFGAERPCNLRHRTTESPKAMAYYPTTPYQTILLYYTILYYTILYYTILD